MTRDPLQVLSRIRDVAVTEAQRALAAALNAEARFEASLHGAHETLRREQQRTGFAEAVAFGNWLPVGRAAIARGEAARQQAAADVVQCRAVLAASHAEAEAVMTMLRQREQVAALARQRREQAALDEAGAQMLRRRRPQSQPS